MTPARLLGALSAAALLAACAGNAANIPSQTAFNAPATLQNLSEVFPDAAPAKCKGQKNSKLYASVAKEALKKKGGSLCIPSFGGWGGALQYPQTYGTVNYAVALTSSTKAYSGGSFPPNGSLKPIYYLQMSFDGFPGFYPTAPKGNPLVSSHLEPNKPYTIELWVNLIVAWSELGACYQVAAKSKYGGALASGGTLFEKQTFLEMTGALEVLKGQLVSNKC